MNIRDHYENHLSRYYSWIFGNYDSKIAENLAFFNKHTIKPELNGLAIDLGAGNGFQSIPLARLGFEVKAIDLSPSLLNQLKEHAQGLNIEIIEADFLNFENYTNFSPEVVVCMGDTLTHLPDAVSVNELIYNAYRVLQPAGKIILTFRDLSVELKDEQRFIPVMQSDTRIFTCFLEYFKGYVKVFDVVNEINDGAWKQYISYYKKLRLSRSDVERTAENAGFKISVSGVEKGFATIIAIKE